MSKPFCKVCFDAGKSEKEYTSHYPRSSPEPTSKVVCPTLLSQECKFCGKKNAGHTASYCPELAKAKKEEVKRQKQQQQKAKKEEEAKKEEDAKKKKTKKIANKFSALDDEDEEEEEQEQKQFNTADFPQLSRGTAETKQANKQATPTTSNTNVAMQLKSLFPELSVQTKFKTETFINANAHQFKLVHKAEAEAQAQEAAVAPEDDYVQDQDDAEVEEINNNYNTLMNYNYNYDLENRPYMKASDMDWTAIEEEESDEEDW